MGNALHREPGTPPSRGFESSMFGSSYRSPYPYYKRDYDVHKKIWDPYVNRPSIGQRIFEILCLLIALAAVPSFLGGVYQIFIAFAGWLLGIFGLFAWTRRHTLTWIILDLLLIAATIVSIILRDSDDAVCIPFIDHNINRNLGVVPLPPNGIINGSPASSFYNGRFDSTWCGNDTLTYITNGILLGLLLLTLPFAIKVATERRRRFYDYDYVGGAAPAAAATTLPSGHTAYVPYTPRTEPTVVTGGAVQPAVAVGTPVYVPGAPLQQTM